MNTPFYKTTTSQIIFLILFILGIITAIACYKISKKQQPNKVFFGTLIGYLFPVIPYIYLKIKYKI